MFVNLVAIRLSHSCWVITRVCDPSSRDNFSSYLKISHSFFNFISTIIGIKFLQYLPTHRPCLWSVHKWGFMNQITLGVSIRMFFVFFTFLYQVAILYNKKKHLSDFWTSTMSPFVCWMGYSMICGYSYKEKYTSSFFFTC